MCFSSTWSTLGNSTRPRFQPARPGTGPAACPSGQTPENSGTCALKWRMNCWRRSIEICSTAQVRYRRNKSGYATGEVSSCWAVMLAQHLHGLVVFAHGHEKLCLLLNIEQLFWINDVVQWCLRCWCSRGAGSKPASSSETSPGSAAFSAATACTTGMGAAGRGRSGGQGTTPAVCRRCNHLFHSFQIDHTWLVSPSTADRHGLTP